MEVAGRYIYSSWNLLFYTSEKSHLTRFLYIVKLTHSRQISTTADHAVPCKQTSKSFPMKTVNSKSSEICDANQNVTSYMESCASGRKPELSFTKDRFNSTFSSLAPYTWCRKLSLLQSSFTKQTAGINSWNFNNQQPGNKSLRIHQKGKDPHYDTQKTLLSGQGDHKLRNFSQTVFKCKTQVWISPSILSRWKANIVTDMHQLRFYRGRMRNQLSPSESGANDVSEDTSLEGAMETFYSDLQETENEFGKYLTPPSVEEMSIPELSRNACNLVPYVSRSETLQNLVKLGVNLDVVQRVEGVAELLLQSQFERDIAPLIHLLNLVGVPADAMGQLITRNPLLFTQSIEDLSSRIGYLLHKKFSQADVASIITRAPVILLMDPVKLDSKLAFLQSTFNLTGQEVRFLVLKYPKVVPWRRDMIAGVRFHLKEFLAFSNSQLKDILLKEPKIYFSNPSRLTEVFDYLHVTMGISREQMIVWPSILRTRPHIIRDRHLFLVACGRAQYDPCQENFVSLKALAASRDGDFCRNVAKCGESDFYDFLKTL